MLQEAPGNLLVGRIHPQSEVRDQHGRRMTLRRVEGIRNRGGSALRPELIGPSRALLQLPFIFEQVLEKAVAPLRRRRAPGDFRAAGDRVFSFPCAIAALPAEAHLLNGRSFRLGNHKRGIASAVSLAEAVSAGDERNRLLVVHRHALEGLANVDGGGHRIRLEVRPVRIHVDQAHMHGSQRILEIADAAVALVATRIREPGLLLAPVDDLVGLPHIGAPAAEAECLEAHGFERDIAGKDHEVGPRDLRAVFPLDRPQEPARLIEVRIVRPGAEGCEALLAGAGAAATVADAVRARGVPRHANHEPAVVAEIRRPPVLAVRHQRTEVFLQAGVIELLELLGVVESLAHGIRLGRVRAENPQVQLSRPPVFVRPHANIRGPVHDRALARLFVSRCVHVSLQSWSSSLRIVRMDHLDQSASSAFCKRPTCDFPALASVSNQSAISSKPSWRATRAMPGYMSVYSWISLAIAALRMSPVGPIGLPVAGSPTSSRYSRWPCACPVLPSAVERNTAARSLKPSTSAFRAKQR